MSKDSQQSEEVDLGQLFKLIGNMFERLFKFIGSIFNKFFLAFVWIVFFVKKHFIKLAIAGVVGIILGFTLQKTADPTYKSYIIVKQNYATGESLYSSIDYYNDLVDQNDIGTLSKVLDIDSTYAASITDFDIKSVIDENDRLKNYDVFKKELDSVLASTFEYSTYLENEKDYNHNFQQITIKAKERNNFKIVFDRIVDNINSNSYFKGAQQKELAELQNRKTVLSSAIAKSDSLMNVYKKVLVMDEEKPSSQTSITFKNTEDKNKTREFDLYLNDLELQREIVEIEREIAEKQQILEVISGKQETGAIDNKKEVLGLKTGYKLYYGFALGVLMFVVLLGVEFIKYLEQFKDKI